MMLPSVRAGAFAMLALVVLGVAPLAGCGRKPEPVAIKAIANDPHLNAQEELEQGSMDFSNVVVVRLQREGKRVEVTSVLPAVIAEATVSGQPAKTIFRMNPQADGLILFSRDIFKGSSERVELPLTKLEADKGLGFRVVQPDGSLKEEKFGLERIVRPGQGAEAAP